MQPDIRNLLLVTEKLEKRGIPYALGGSGLLHSLGLTDTVHDWDLTTEAPKNRIIDALHPLYIEEIVSGDFPFASRYKLLIHEQEPQVELFGHFSIQAEKGLCQLPAIPVFQWKGVHVGSHEVWYVAYALMNRKDKASLLLSYLEENGVRGNILQRLLSEPLPDGIARNLAALPLIS
jgi:hypothetical protein